MTDDKNRAVLAELLGTMRERCTDPCRSEKAELGCDCDAARRAAVMLRQPTQSDALLIANERKAIAAWLRGEVDTDYTDPEYDIGRNLADAVERGAYIQDQSK